MKFREQVVRYDIDKHGSAYVDYSAPIYICPECSSAETKLKEGCSVTYVCPDCGCQFRQHTVNELTRHGHIAENVCSILAVIFVILAATCIVGGIAFAIYVGNKKGGDVPHPYDYISYAISFGGCIICGLLACLFAKLYDKI